MYIHYSFLDESFLSSSIWRFKWESDLHRELGEAVLLCNPNIRTKEKLIRSAHIINSLSEIEVVRVTIGDLAEMGIPVG